MRISDWSSDVCSSDLPGPLQALSATVGAFAPLLQGVVGIFALVTAAQWAWNAAQLASPMTWVVAGIVALIAVIVLIATKTDWFQKAWSAAWGWIKRSEEHTSELQSLMRISYAVFCLKKKK